MHVDFEISESDYISAAQLYHRTRNSATKVLAVLAVVSRIVRVGVVLGLLVFAVTQNRSLELVAAIAAVLLLPMTRIYFVRRKLGAVYRANPAIKLEKWMDVDAHGIANQAAEGAKMRPWTDFSRVEESRKTFILCMSRSAGYLILPKRRMSSEQRDEFRQMVRIHLNHRSLGNVPLVRPQVGLPGQ